MVLNFDKSWYKNCCTTVGGSIRDQEVINAAKVKIKMLFTGVRHLTIK